MSRKFTLLVEVNDWENETWGFFIPLKGNEEAIDYLKKVLKDTDYIINGIEFTETEVDALINNDDDDCGYMARHNKYDFIIDFDKLKKADFKNDDPLYKGQLDKFKRK